MVTALPILGDTLCAKCVGLCCKYITIEIDKPSNKRERDDIRWYLLHEGITLLVEDGRWMVKVPTTCTALGENNECTIYEDRPQACREYSTDNCDYHSVFGDWDTDYLEIETAEEFEKYLEREKRKKKRDKAKKK